MTTYITNSTYSSIHKTRSRPPRPQSKSKDTDCIDNTNITNITTNTRGKYGIISHARTNDNEIYKREQNRILIIQTANVNSNVIENVVFRTQYMQN